MTGTIHMGTTSDNTVPANADIVGAFLYWESIYAGATPPTGVQFRGIPAPAIKITPQLLTQDTPCWATGST